MRFLTSLALVARLSIQESNKWHLLPCSQPVPDVPDSNPFSGSSSVSLRSLSSSLQKFFSSPITPCTTPTVCRSSPTAISSSPIHSAASSPCWPALCSSRRAFASVTSNSTASSVASTSSPSLSAPSRGLPSQPAAPGCQEPPCRPPHGSSAPPLPSSLRVTAKSPSIASGWPVPTPSRLPSSPAAC